MRFDKPLVLLLVLATSLAAAAADAPAPATPQDGRGDFLTGLDAMQRKDWKSAADAFAQAISADDENAQYHTARGIALFLNGDNADAREEFDRSLHLDSKNRTTSMWAAAFYRGTGDPMTASRIHATSDYTGTPQEAAEQLYQTRYDRKSPQEVQALRDRLDAFAVKFAADIKASQPDLGTAIRTRLEANFTAGHWKEVLADAGPLLTANPRDVDILYYQAVCWMNLGDLTDAREQLTRVLTFATDASNAYAQRAVVEARLGNFKRARADLESAKQFNSAVLKTCSDQVEAEIAAQKTDPADQSPADIWAQIQNAAQTASDPNDLVPLVLQMQRAMNARRLRWDELYQEKLRQLGDVVRAKPNDVQAWLDLGIFLYRECDIPGEPHGPGGVYRAFRYDGDHERDNEIRGADGVFDKVLQLDPRNALAMTWKAAIRLENGNWDDGVQWVDKALAIQPEIPELLELLTRVLDDAAWCKSFDATNLRTAKTWTTWGIDTYTIWTRYPSQADINQADTLDQQAQQLWANAEQSLIRAAQSRAGSADGFFYDGLLRLRRNDNDGAIADFETAVRMEPTVKRDRLALMRAYRKAGRDADAINQHNIYIAQCETTATAYLAQAWNDFDRTAYHSAQSSAAKHLASAVSTDPADGRIPAYYAVFAVDVSPGAKSDDAIKWLNVAQAYQIAGAQLRGADITATGTGMLQPRDVAMYMLLNLHLAAQYHMANQPDLELGALQRNLALRPRLAKDTRFVAPPGAVLPCAADPIATTPRTIGNLLAWSHVLAGYNLLAAGKADEAVGHFNEVANWRRGNDIFEPQAIAVSTAARRYWAQNDPTRQRRSQWEAAANTMTRITRQEIGVINSILTAHPTGDGRDVERHEAYTMGLSYFQQEINIQGGYQERYNANYHGTKDCGPDGQVHSQ